MIFRTENNSNTGIFRIEKVKGMSAHAHTRVGKRICDISEDQDGSIWLQYLSFDGVKKGFKVPNSVMRKTLFGRTVISSPEGSYVLVPVSEAEMVNIERYDTYARQYNLVESVYGENVWYMSPEQVMTLAAELRQA